MSNDNEMNNINNNDGIAENIISLVEHRKANADVSEFMQDLDELGLTEQEFGDLSFWGVEFRKSILVQHAADMRLRQGKTYVPTTFGDVITRHLTLAIGALLIQRASTKEIGELVDSLRKSDVIIADLFQTLINDVQARA
jgi:hypothetical protein